MNSRWILSTLGVALSAVVGCAGASDGASESDVSGAAQSVETGISACRNRKECINAFVLRTVFNSKLSVKGGFGDDKGEGRPAGEFVASWLQSDDKTRGSIDIETTPAGSGKTAVRIGLLNSDIDPAAGTESGCSIKFTIERDHIVEQQVEASCAG